jgi:hypothetical protein
MYEVHGMAARAFAVLVVAGALVGLGTVPARAGDACWQLLYSALERSAATAHVPYVSYSETLRLIEDGQPLERARAEITYRDDGLASVVDDRFSQPFLSNVEDPGPPELGPYGDRRAAWLSFGDEYAPLPVIADTETAHRVACDDRGDDTIDGESFAHLTFPNAPTDRPALKAIWISRHTLAIRRAVVSGWLRFVVPDARETRALADYTLEITQIDGHAVLAQVNWRYVFVVDGGQQTTLEEEYRFDGYRFDNEAPPDTLFGQGQGKQQK